MSELVLQVQHLSKSFGSHEILRDIDFSVHAGDVTSIIGASGSGKSTLLRCINLLETPSDGHILFHGQDMAGRHTNAAALCTAKKSLKPMMNMTEVSLTLMIKLLPICGMMLRRACGSTTLSMVCTCVMPMAFAPSVCPRSTERMPPRTDSAMYAPVLMDTTRMDTAQILRNCTALLVK